MRITKVYTRTGDKGTTGLADGSRVAKTDGRIEAYGTVDELNAFVGQSIILAEQTSAVRLAPLGSLGLLHAQARPISVLGSAPGSGRSGGGGDEAQQSTTAHPGPATHQGLGAYTLTEVLALIQHDLFNIGADLATPIASRFKGMVLIGEREPETLELLMDVMSEGLPPLREFVLPGGTALGASLHVVRTVCRRAERRVVELATHTELNPQVLIYLNRLSDFFFVASRWVLAVDKQPEITWSKHRGLGSHMASKG